MGERIMRPLPTQGVKASGGLLGEEIIVSSDVATYELFMTQQILPTQALTNGSH